MSSIYNGGFVPVNKLATTVTSPSSQPDITIPKELLREHWDVMPPTKALPLRDRGFKNMMGVKFGRFTVVGLSAQNMLKWVVRCACGVYEIRSNDAVKRGAKNSRCCRCVYTLRLQKQGSSTLPVHMTNCFEECPPLAESATHNDAADNLSGRKIAHLTVVGLSVSRPNCWVARCECGLYTIKTRKNLLERESGSHRCPKCVWRQGKNL